MILDFEQIKEIILKNPNQALVTKGQKYNTILRMHMYGEGRETALTKIDGFESDGLRELRTKYFKSNKDLCARLTRPIDKVFSARGGSTYYNLPEAQDKKARQLVSDVRGGVSVKKWVENTWRSHYLDDPYGLVFMEISKKQQVALLKQQGKSYVYPTYKSIQCVYDYLPNGDSLEYVVFKMEKNDKIAEGLNVDEQIYRLVDDAFDYYIKRDGEEVTILTKYTLPNLFNKVPAIRNSDIPDPSLDGGVLSFLDTIVESANEFLLKGSIKITHTFMHGFPKYWQYVGDCNKCGGDKVFEGSTCPDCKGTGKKLIGKVSDALFLNFPESKDSPVVTPEVGGYIEPSKTYYEISTHDMQMLEDSMGFTLWGASPAQKTNGMSMDDKGDMQTATQVMNEIKPQADRLTAISQCGEKREKFIIDNVVLIQIMKGKSYEGASVNYGNRYMLESPDELLLKYIDTKTKGASETMLDSLLGEYYEAAYFNDPVELSIKQKLVVVEPSVHLTTEQVKNLGFDEEYIKMKLYFGDWKRSLKQGELITLTAEQLTDSLKEYVSAIKLPVPIEQQQLEFEKTQAKLDKAA